jgi:dGTPase
MQAIRSGKVDPFIGKRIGRYIQSTQLRECVNFLSHQSKRYRYELVVAEEVRHESELFKKLAFEVVFLSPQLKQLEHKGNHMLHALWDLLEKRYIAPGHIDGQLFQILGNDTAAEIAQAPDAAGKARLICDFLAGMTDGYAARMYKRLFLPDFGSIHDLIG